MIIKQSLIIILYISGCSVFAQTDNTVIKPQKDPNTTLKKTKKDYLPKKLKLAMVSGVSASALAGSYYYVNNAWWADKKRSFHFDKGRDLEYAGNLDKVAHFYGGMIYSEAFAAALRWAEVSPKKSVWFGGLLGFSTHLFVEMKDAYSPYFGFSYYDLIAGTAGGIYTIAKEYSKITAATDIKFSYFVKSRAYLDSERYDNVEGRETTWHDDYMNQTYWISFYPSRLKKNQTDTGNRWYDALGISLGVSVDEVTSGLSTGKGDIQYYLSLDLDWKQIITSEKKFFKTLAHVLNYTKVPLPTIRITPQAKFIPLYY